MHIYMYIYTHTHIYIYIYIYIHVIKLPWIKHSWYNHTVQKSYIKVMYSQNFMFPKLMVSFDAWKSIHYINAILITNTMYKDHNEYASCRKQENFSVFKKSEENVHTARSSESPVMIVEYNIFSSPVFLKNHKKKTNDSHKWSCTFLRISMIPNMFWLTIYHYSKYLIRFDVKYGLWR